MSEMFSARLQYIPALCFSQVLGNILFLTSQSAKMLELVSKAPTHCFASITYLFPPSVLQLLNTCAVSQPRRVCYIQLLTSRLLLSIYSSLFTVQGYFISYMYFSQYRPQLFAQKKKNCEIIYLFHIVLSLRECTLYIIVTKWTALMKCFPAP